MRFLLFSYLGSLRRYSFVGGSGVAAVGDRIGGGVVGGEC